MGNEGALARADDVLIMADGVDFRGWDGAHSLATVWIAEDNNCGGEVVLVRFVYCRAIMYVAIKGQRIS